jgi:HEPN domain-containing protein
MGGLSGEYVVKLKRRALGFLKAADQVDDTDLAAFFVEQAMQLCIKAVLYELFWGRGLWVMGSGSFSDSWHNI